MRGCPEANGSGKKAREPDVRIPGRLELEALQKIDGYQM
jgi:hypothetical protein